jgi:hypothetical protein
LGRIVAASQNNGVNARIFFEGKNKTISSIISIIYYIILYYIYTIGLQLVKTLCLYIICFPNIPLRQKKNQPKLREKVNHGKEKKATANPSKLVTVNQSPIWKYGNQGKLVTGGHHNTIPRAVEIGAIEGQGNPKP